MSGHFEIAFLYISRVVNFFDKNYRCFFSTLIEKYILATFKLKPFKN